MIGRHMIEETLWSQTLIINLLQLHSTYAIVGEIKTAEELQCNLKAASLSNEPNLLNVNTTFPYLNLFKCSSHK